LFFCSFVLLFFCSFVLFLSSLTLQNKTKQNKTNQNNPKQKKMSDLVAFRAARRALSAKRVPRWRGDVADIALGEGGYGTP
jgi:hypothetical protein